MMVGMKVGWREEGMGGRRGGWEGGWRDGREDGWVSGKKEGRSRDREIGKQSELDNYSQSLCGTEDKYNAHSFFML